MSFGGRTPESLLPRSDSKNPATTCKGITANGRPCRRALATASTACPSNNGILAVLNKENAFFCWQHKIQAESLAAQSDTRAHLFPLKERSSIDTLADRVGVFDLEGEIQKPKRVYNRGKHNDERRVKRRDTHPPSWHNVQSPLTTVPEEITKPVQNSRPQAGPTRSNTKLSWSCCLRVDEDERPSPKRQQNQRCETGYRSPAPMRTHMTRPNAITHATETAQKPARPNFQDTSNSNSQTQTLLSLIPSTLSPQTTSALLTELSRPISPHDEAGYIYIFWLTPESEASKPDDETASSLLDSDDILDRSPARASRTTNALNRYASVKHPHPSTPRTVLLKIGRTQNVHRRLSQWTKQCGQNITLVRYYPQSSSHHHDRLSSTSASPRNATTIPFVTRVERLIHLELAEKRVKQEKCEQCGREHREWFEIEASRKGLRQVDGVVKRWVGWAEGEERRRQRRQEQQQRRQKEPPNEDERVGRSERKPLTERAAERRVGGEGRSRGNDLGGYF